MDKTILTTINKIANEGNKLATKIKHLKTAIILMKNHGASAEVVITTGYALMAVSSLIDCKLIDTVVLDHLEHELLVAEMEFADL